MNWLKNIVVGWLKAAAIAVIQKEGDALQDTLREIVASEKDPKRIEARMDAVIDGAQRRIDRGIKTWGPDWPWLEPIREKVAAALQKFGDDLQKGIKGGIREHGPKAIDKVFDTAQAALIKAIEALKL